MLKRVEISAVVPKLPSKSEDQVQETSGEPLVTCAWKVVDVPWEILTDKHFAQDTAYTILHAGFLMATLSPEFPEIVDVTLGFDSVMVLCQATAWKIKPFGWSPKGANEEELSAQMKEMPFEVS